MFHYLHTCHLYGWVTVDFYFINNQKMKNYIPYFILLIILASCTQRETNFLETKDAYFGLEPPGLVPEVFAPGIASDTNWAEHCQVAISPTGDEIYWSAWTADYKTEDGERNTEQIFYSKFVNGAWTEPKRAEFIKDNPHGLNGGPVFSPDGNKLFFYQVKSPWVSSNMDTYYVEKKNEEWSNEPVILSDSYNSEKQNYSPIFTKKGIAYKNLFGKISKYNFNNNRFTLIDSIVVYNGFRQAWNFYISPDEDYIIFADRQEDGYGDFDLYLSFKTEGDIWSYPVNMGPGINTELRERFPVVSPDGKYLFFMRHAPGQDFFWVSAKVVEELRYEANNPLNQH